MRKAGMVLVAVWSGFATGVFAQPPALIHYQGRLLNGTNLAQGPVDMRLRLYDDLSGGTLLYEDTGTVTVVDGVYETRLGDGPASGSLVNALTNPAVYLETVVNGTALSPRERLTSVPYALQSLTTLQHAETDPRFAASPAFDINAAQTARWEQAFAWGDHATNGYLTGFAEADPVWSGASNAYYTKTQADAAFATGTPIYAESDPLFGTSVAAGITAEQTSAWSTAYGWGDHATNGYLTGFAEADPVWSGSSNLYYQRVEADAQFATGTPVYAESDPVFGASVAAGITSAETTRWETAYGWGDHATNGYLTGFAEADPVWSGSSNLYYQRVEADAQFATGTPIYAESDPAFGASVAAGITAEQTSAWSTAYGWGDHATNGYLTGFAEADPVWSGSSNLYYQRAEADAQFATGTPIYAESDPAFGASVAAGITAEQTSAWSTAYGWGDHATNGYLTGFAEVDPVWSGSSNLYYQRAEADAQFATGTPIYAESDPAFGTSVAAGITAEQTSAWSTAYGWGDHATNGYLTGFAEADPVWSAASNAYYTKLQADVLFSTGMPVYVESDPAFSASVAESITSAHTTRWETAYGWGHHATNGYLTSFTEADPLWSAASNSYYSKTQADARFATGAPVYVEGDAVYAASVAAQITSTHTGRWETAFGWGNHAAAGYMTGAAISNGFVRKTGDTVSLAAGGLAVGTTQLVVLANGNVGIGTANPTNQLAVNGSIKAREVIVTANNWPDYVFDPAYRLVPLRDVQAFINENGHLPGVPSARQIEQGGVPLGEFGATLLRKIEELTLHQIALEQENERLRRDLDELRASSRPVAP